MYQIEIRRLSDDELERVIPDIPTVNEAQRRKESINFRLDSARYYSKIALTGQCSSTPAHLPESPDKPAT